MMNNFIFFGGLPIYIILRVDVVAPDNRRLLGLVDCLVDLHLTYSQTE